MLLEKVIVPVFSRGCFFILLCLFHLNVKAQEPIDEVGLEISAGTGVVIYQSAFATQNITGLEVAARGGLHHPIQWQAGARFWLEPTSPELFGRLLFSQQSGSWSPMVGLELGATGKPKFGEGSKLLRETRQAMLTDSGPFYMSIHIAPLSFTWSETWRISAAEINFGTHLKNMGRTLRLHLSIISLSKIF